MKKTFVCDESMIITIPIGSLKDAREGQLMPEKFRCVYRDSFKVFAFRGKPKPLGAAQAIAGVFILTLGLIFSQTGLTLSYTVPNVVFVVSGMLSYAAGQYPNMHVTKLSFSVNIVGFFWSIVAVYICTCWFNAMPEDLQNVKVNNGVIGLILSLLVVEMLTALFLIYWLSKAVCRDNFNTLPIILLKQGD